MLVALGQLGERVRRVAQAFERSTAEISSITKRRRQLAARPSAKRDARIERMQVAALAALELAKLRTEGCSARCEAIGAAPRPRPAQHRALERRDGARVRSLRARRAGSADA